MVSKLAVAGARRFDGGSEGNTFQFAGAVDDAYSAVMSSIETKHCLNRNAQEALWDEVEEFVEALRPPTRNVTGAGLDFFSILQNLTIDPGRLLDDEARADEDHVESLPLQRIEQLCNELRIVLDKPLMSTQEVEGHINAGVPGTRGVSVSVVHCVSRRRRWPSEQLIARSCDMETGRRIGAFDT